MPNLIQNSHGSMGIQGLDQDKGGFIPVNIVWGASGADVAGFVADRAYRVMGIRARITTAGTDAGAVTAQVRKSPSGTSVPGGTVLHSGTFDMKAAANSVSAATLSTTSSDLNIVAGDTIGLDFTGTMTAAVGVITVNLAPM